MYSRWTYMLEILPMMLALCLMHFHAYYAGTYDQISLKHMMTYIHVNVHQSLCNNTNVHQTYASVHSYSPMTDPCLLPLQDSHITNVHLYVFLWLQYSRYWHLRCTWICQQSPHNYDYKLNLLYSNCCLGYYTWSSIFRWYIIHVHTYVDQNIWYSFI